MIGFLFHVLNDIINLFPVAGALAVLAAKVDEISPQILSPWCSHALILNINNLITLIITSSRVILSYFTPIVSQPPSRAQSGRN